MAESIVFRGAHVRYFDGRQEEGGAFVRVHMTSEFSAPVMAEMDWQDPGPSVTDAKLGGELHGTHLILTPGDKQLRNAEIQFDIRSVEDFKVVTIEKDEMKRRELRFVVRSSAPGVAALVDDYIRRIGEHQGAMKVSYVKQEEMDLQEEKKPGSETTERDTGCTSCNNSIAFTDDTQIKHTNGLKCSARGGEAGTLPSMREMAGGTTADAKRKRGPRKAATAGYPIPNDCGVYEPDPKLTLEFFGKKCAAAIEYLQIGPDEWIATASASTTNSSHSGPLSADVVYPSMEIAIAKEAFNEAERAEEYSNDESQKPAIRKEWGLIYEWFSEKYGLYAGRVSPETGEGWMEIDYRVAPQSAEAVQ